MLIATERDLVRITAHELHAIFMQLSTLRLGLLESLAALAACTTLGRVRVIGCKAIRKVC